jgi:Icc-related predicted phosphoesterase
MPRLVLLSDTHNAHDEIIVPDGDILIHAGDATNYGTIEEIRAFNRWFKNLPHKHKILVAGNHDWLFEKAPELAQRLLAPNIIYLQDSTIEIENLKIYGSPWQPCFFDWAFNLPRGAALAERWQLIPSDTNVLITHGPAYGILDQNPSGNYCGCEELLKFVEKIKPQLHVFGHIHYSYGVTEKFGVRFANASNCDENYNPINTPLVINL